MPSSSSEFINAADPDNPTDIELNAAGAAAKEAYLATRFLAHCDLSRYYGALIGGEVENAHTRGVDSYPRTLTKAYDMLVNYVNPCRNNTSSGADISQGISFFQQDDQDAGRGRGSGSGRGAGGGSRGGRGGGRGVATSGKAMNRSGQETSNTNSDPVESLNDTSPTVKSYPLSNKESQRHNEDAPHSFSHVKYTTPTVFMQHGSDMPKTWLLADSCS
jgi:hypothetical protein